MGRLTQRSAAVLGTEQAPQTETFTYTASGQLSEAHNAHTKLQWYYDERGHLTREHHHHLATKQTAIWHHTYDELGQRCSTTRPDGHTVQ
jgi:YD repeat-containing protein